MPDMRRILVFLFVSILFATSLPAQETLPGFSAAARGAGKILISWHNKYPVVSQISIQRSLDSLKNFTTLITVPDPGLPENGIVDSKAVHPNFFYRLFIVLENGKYLFTPSRRAHANAGDIQAALKDRDDDPGEEDPIVARAGSQRMLFADPGNNKTKSLVKPPSVIHALPEVDVQKPMFVKRGDSLIGQIPGNRIRQFRDSLLTRTRDTLVFIDGDSLQIRPFAPREIYRVSAFVFTGKYGNIHLSLPEAGKRHYTVKFFDENNRSLFELSEIKDPSLIVDKSNFQHAGWFRYELYEGDQLKEKNKLLIPL